MHQPGLQYQHHNIQELFGIMKVDEIMVIYLTSSETGGSTKDTCTKINAIFH